MYLSTIASNAAGCLDTIPEDDQYWSLTPYRPKANNVPYIREGSELFKGVCAYRVKL